MRRRLVTVIIVALVALTLPALALAHDAPETAQRYFTPISGPWRSDTLSTRSHTGTGLLIGGLVGGVATAVFLAGFCSDADTQCGADEIGRAVLFIAVPTALVGTLIGSLIRTKR